MTKHIGREDLPEGVIPSRCALWTETLLRSCQIASTGQLVVRICHSLNWLAEYAPNSFEPADAGDATNPGIQDDGVKMRDRFAQFGGELMYG